MKFGDIISQRIPKLKGKIRIDNIETEMTRTLYLYRKEFGLSHEELRKEPLSAFFGFLKEINKENEKQKSEMEKMRKKK
jgi:hypothetical protein